MNGSRLDDIVNSMVEAVTEASHEIMRIYNDGFHVDIKSDNSPVTDADLASNRIIHSHLDSYKEIGWLSEEDKDNPERLEREYVFVVDPLDGTQDFVNRDNSFGINLALVKDHEPLIGIVAVPYYQLLVFAYKGRGTFLFKPDHSRERLHVSDRTDHLVYLSSKTHELPREKKIVTDHADRIEKVIHSGASVKAFLLASGIGDASIRFTDKTKEWDVCAPDIIVREAGGIFLDTKKKPFVYNRKDVYNHDGYCMFNRVENMDLLNEK